MQYLVTSITQGGTATAAIIDAVSAQVAADLRGEADCRIFVCELADITEFEKPTLAVAKPKT